MGQKKFNVGIFGLIIKLLPKLIKSGKVIKVALAGATLAGYSLVFTWKFALLVMIAVGVHESGHVWAMRKVGIKTKGFYFLPFVGGVAVAEKNFPSREAEIFVAIMGPVWGLGTAIIPAIFFFINKDPMWAAASSWIALINLFNLLPIHPLDGGRIFKAIAFTAGTKSGYAFLILGTIASTVLMVQFGLILFAILLPLGLLEIAGEIYSRKKAHKEIEYLKYQIKTVEKSILPDHPYRDLLKSQLDELIVFTRSVSKHGVIITIGSYAFLVITLWTIMLGFKEVPGADLAVQFMKE